MVAPGRYVRVEESETTPGASPSTAREKPDDRSGHDVSAGDAPDSRVDENASTVGGSKLPSDADFDRRIAPGKQEQNEISTDLEG